MIREAMLYDKLDNNKVKCKVCNHRCTIAPGKRGFCRTRENRDGTLYTLIYNVVSSEAVDPIEKKPLFHFYPGSLSYSLETIGCNFRCKHCQNWMISQISVDEAVAFEIPPETAVERALATGSRSIAWTYNEPTIWHEYTYDSAKLAKELGMHIEVINLIVPTKNDSPDEIRDLSKWVHDNLGPDTPLHFTRFHPEYKTLDLPPTPVKTLEMAHEIATEEGMRFVYIGNVYGHKYENTYCPKCGELLIKRDGFAIVDYKITPQKKCSYCGEKIPIVGEYTESE